MKRNNIKTFTLLLFLAFTVSSMGQTRAKNTPVKKGNFDKKTFSTKSTGGNVKAIGPPNPDDGGGNPIPISGGLIILVAGSTVYLSRKIKCDLKSK